MSAPDTPADRPAPQAYAGWAVCADDGTLVSPAYWTREIAEAALGLRRGRVPGNYDLVPCTVVPDGAPLPPDVVARAREVLREHIPALRAAALREAWLDGVSARAWTNHPETAGVEAPRWRERQSDGALRISHGAEWEDAADRYVQRAARTPAPRPAPAGEVG